MIAKTMKGTASIGAMLLNSSVMKYAKKRGVWYYRLLLSQQFSDVVTDVYEMNRLEKKLNPDPLSMNATTTATVTLDNCQLQVGDAVTFLNVTDNSVGGVNNVLLSPFAILATNMTTTSSSIVCNETIQFPSSGFVFIESFTTPSATNPDYVPQKNFEVIKYTTNTTGTQTLSGLTRATNAPFRGITPPATTAFEHKVGASIFGAFNVASITTRTQNNPGMPAQITVNTGFTFTLPTATTSTEVGGGPNVYFSPVGRGSV